MEHSTQNKTRQMAACALFATLMAVCSQIQIPLPMVPINLALFGAYLAGAVLGPRLGALSVTVYALMGAVGLPGFCGVCPAAWAPCWAKPWQVTSWAISSPPFFGGTC